MSGFRARPVDQTTSPKGTVNEKLSFYQYSVCPKSSTFALLFHYKPARLYPLYVMLRPDRNALSLESVGRILLQLAIEGC